MLVNYYDFVFENMKRKDFYSLVLFALLPMFVSCENEEFNSEIESNKNVVTVKFAGQIGNLLSSRAVQADATSKELCIVAYRKMESGKYKCAGFKNTSVMANGNEFTWSDSEFRLNVGTYRFLGFYNINQENAQLDLTFSDDMEVEKTWQEVLDAVVISRKSINTDLNVNEIFAGGSSDNNDATENNTIAEDVDLSKNSENNKVVVNLILSRINSRIDFRFLKFSPKEAPGDNTEQYYTTSDFNIFGPKGNLKSIAISTSNASSRWTWGQTASSPFVALHQYTTQGESNVTLGTLVKEGESILTDFPNGDADKDKLENIPAERIAQGAAYYKGVYILPFVNVESKNFDLEVELKGKGLNEPNGLLGEEQTRLLEATGVTAESNKVTVVTFKYRASSNDSDDKENIFNPTITYEVTINTVWNGIIEGPSIDV